MWKVGCWLHSPRKTEKASKDTRGGPECCNQSQVPMGGPRAGTGTLVVVVQDEVQPSEGLASDAERIQMTVIEGTSSRVGRNTSFDVETTAAEIGVPAHHLAWAEG